MRWHFFIVWVYNGRKYLSTYSTIATRRIIAHCTLVLQSTIFNTIQQLDTNAVVFQRISFSLYSFQRY